MPLKYTEVGEALLPWMESQPLITPQSKAMLLIMCGNSSRIALLAFRRSGTSHPTIVYKTNETKQKNPKKKPNNCIITWVTLVFWSFLIYQHVQWQSWHFWCPWQDQTCLQLQLYVSGCIFRKKEVVGWILWCDSFTLTVLHQRQLLARQLISDLQKCNHYQCEWMTQQKFGSPG